MAVYKNIENFRKLFDNEYKSTRKLINEGETHLDNLAEGFSEASRVLDMLPTEDVVPRAEVEKWKNACEHEHKEVCKLEQEKFENLVHIVEEAKQEFAKQIFEDIEKPILSQLGISIMEKKEAYYFCLDTIAELRKKYINCIHYAVCHPFLKLSNALNENCTQYKDLKKKTNYEKITESAESLAKMIVQMSLNGDFVPCFYAPDGTEFVMDKERAIQYTIEWLQKECENGK